MGFQTMSGIPKVTSTANFYSNTNPLLQSRGIGGFAQPSALFGAGEQGAWWDFSDLDNMYQDPTNPTLKAVLEGTVGFVADKRVQTRGAEMVPDPMLRTPAAWLQSAGGATATTTVSVGRIVIDSTDGSNVGVTCLGSVLDSAKYYECQIFVDSCTGVFGIDSGGVVAGRIDSSNGTGLLKFIFKPSATAVFGIKRAGGIGRLEFSQLSVREYVGNHLVQATAGARPVLSRRYNLLSNTEDFSVAGWLKNVGGVASAPVVTNNYQGATSPDGKFNATRVQLALNGGTTTADLAILTQILTATAGATANKIWIRATAGQYTLGAGNGNTPINNIVVNTTWQQVNFTAAAGSTEFRAVTLRGGQVPQHSDSADVLIWHPDCRLSADAALATPEYQRVGAAGSSDYDTLGFPAYLLFDGATKWMQSVGTVDFSGTSKVGVFAGVTKLSDAGGSASLLETSASVSANPGAFLLRASDGAGANYAGYINPPGSSGTAGIIFTPFAAPITSVVTFNYDNAGATTPDEISAQVNNTTIAGTVSLAGTGNNANFGNLTSFIGARGGATGFFNGRLFGLIIRGAVTNANDAAMTNKWMGSKCGLFF